MENCYAIAIRDISNIDIDVTGDGYMPSDKLVTAGKSYKVSVANDEPVGYFAYYKFTKYSNELKPLAKYTIHNKFYENARKDVTFDNIIVTIPKDTEIIFKSGVNITDISNNYTVTNKGLPFSDNFVEPYNFADVSESLKNYVKTEINALRKRDIAMSNNRRITGFKSIEEESVDRRRVFKVLETIPKNDAELLYVHYVKEIYVIYNHSFYNDIMVGKYLYNCSSFKDLNYLLRTMFYNKYRNSSNYIENN